MGKTGWPASYIWRYESVAEPLGLSYPYFGGTMTTWQTVERPGYFGKRRDQKHRDFDERFGAGNWRIVWSYGQRIGSLAEAAMVYEDAYFAFLSGKRGILAELVATASDVYDDDPSNVQSGLDYLCQQTTRTHLQDIAIRRCLVRLGLQFQGSRLLQIRDRVGDHHLSLALSPGHVVFHRPAMIDTPQLEGWWQPDSVESFYQSNKLLQIAV